MIEDSAKVMKQLEDFTGIRSTKEMKNYLAEKKIGPAPKPEIPENTNRVRQRFAAIPAGNKPEPKSVTERRISGFDWQRHLKASRVNEIQKFCGPAMTSWGYNLLESTDKMDKFDSRRKFEM